KSYCLHLALCLKGVGSIIAVSDQSALSGAPLTPLEASQPLWGTSVRVDRHPTLDTSIIIGENGMLAGSWANMLWCMNHMARLFAQWNARNEPWTVADLWQIGRENPLRVLGRTADQLAHLPLAKIAWQDGRFVRLGAGESA
ncbi:MAG TPA: hypothetical protein PLP17_08905, partial [Oligoflexia bacterium]|nr:hypothetical protein [Oligoflexia bacterium]